MAVKPIHILKNPLGDAQGIFCLRTLLLLLIVIAHFTGFSQAKLEVAEAKKNYGYVKRGEIITNVFEISNTGNSPLIIEDVEVSCSCTTVDFPKKPILPGQKAKIMVVFNTTTTYGRQDRVVFVKSNDPKSPHKLRYKGTVSQK
jgi:hypothetical protein